MVTSENNGRSRWLYWNRRMAALLGLGFASGLPNVMVADTLRAWLSSVGVNVKAIGLFGLVTFPYVFKFLWAPLLDRYVPPLLGRRRGWLLLAQVGMTWALICIAAVGPRSGQESLVALAVLGIIVVFLSASQDIVADAYRADVLPRPELAAGAATFVTGYRLATIAGSAGAMFLAQYAGWSAAYLALAAVMGLMIFVTILAPEPAAVTTPATLQEAVVEPVRQFARRFGWHAIVVLAFVFLFRLPDILASAMTQPLLIQDLHYSLAEVATVRQFIGFYVVILGALAGGVLTPRLGITASLWVFGLLQVVSNAGFLILTQVGNDAHVVWQLPGGVAITHGLLWLVGVIVVESLCSGLVTAGFVAYLMSLCQRRYSAFQYAFFSALMAAATLAFVPATGYLVSQWGYRLFFALTIAAGVPSLALLPWLAISAATTAAEDESSSAA